jgi:KAP family P-loop domain
MSDPNISSCPFYMRSNIQQHGDKSLSDELKRALRSVLYGLQFKIGYLGIDVSPKDIKEQWDAQGLPALEQAFSKPFSELRRIPKALDGRRVAVLIDDLDRCSPEKVISVLESINLVMDVPGIIFVLALDYDVLVSRPANNFTIPGFHLRLYLSEINGFLTHSE